MKKLLFSFLVAGLAAFTFQPAAAQMQPVTFTVDMSDYTGSFTTVYIAGGFNSWTDANPLMDMGDNIWSGVIMLADGTYECKFMVDNWADDETFSGAESCTTPPGAYVNRIFDVAGAPVSVGGCWESCDACGTGPANGAITFSVDMSEYTDPFTTVFLSGGFNGWCGGCNPMTDMGNGIWETTVTFPGGFNEYKFQLDEWSAEETFDGTESCTTDPGAYVNRVVMVDGDAALSTVCFNSCDPCSAVGTVNVLENNELFTLQPTLANQFTTLEFNLDRAAKEVSLYNAMGQVFLSEMVEQGVPSYEISTSQLANGVYFVRVQMENDIQIQKIMVNR